MAVVSMSEYLRAMGKQDYENGLPRHAVPGDLAGDEQAWLEGWDAARAQDYADRPIVSEFSS
jgi:hypothetical protein